MLSVRSVRRLCSISARSTSGRAPFHPPLVATTQSSGTGESAAPIVSSLCPPVYVWAVSIRFTPAATACFTNVTCSGVFVSRFVPSPIPVTSVSPSLSFAVAFKGRMLRPRFWSQRRFDRHRRTTPPPRRPHPAYTPPPPQQTDCPRHPLPEGWRGSRCLRVGPEMAQADAAQCVARLEGAVALVPAIVAEFDSACIRLAP